MPWGNYFSLSFMWGNQLLELSRVLQNNISEMSEAFMVIFQYLLIQMKNIFKSIQNTWIYLYDEIFDIYKYTTILFVIGIFKIYSLEGGQVYYSFLPSLLFIFISIAIILDCRSATSSYIRHCYIQQVSFSIPQNYCILYVCHIIISYIF